MSANQSENGFGLVVEDQDPEESAKRVMEFAKAMLEAAKQGAVHSNLKGERSSVEMKRLSEEMMVMIAHALCSLQVALRVMVPMLASSRQQVHAIVRLLNSIFGLHYAHMYPGITLVEHAQVNMPDTNEPVRVRVGLHTGTADPTFDLCGYILHSMPPELSQALETPTFVVMRG
eukprot:1156918-Pelagomonas_calceolata.AAC.1